MPVALVAAISVAAVSVISARSGDGECEGGKGHGRLSTGWAELAELVGTDADGLNSALREGQTLAQIAEANGVEVQTVIDALVVKANERIDAAVEAGRLTEDEAATKRSAAATRIEDVVNNGFNGERFRSWGKGRWRGHGQGMGGDVESS